MLIDLKQKNNIFRRFWLDFMQFLGSKSAQKRRFWPSRQLWSTRVDHMLMLSPNEFGGLVSIHLKCLHPKYHGMKPKIHREGSEKPFFRVWGRLLE